MPIKTIFLDRDGVINKDVGYLHKIDEFEFIDGVFEACLFFQKLDFEVIIISNQSGISRGFYPLADYKALTKWMLHQFKIEKISILDTFYCPHKPDAKCNCRKPMPGMLNKAREKFNIDMRKSWMIGDKETDIKAANLAGIKNTILVRSGHLIDETNSNARFVIDSIKESRQIIKA